MSNTNHALGNGALTEASRPQPIIFSSLISDKLRCSYYYLLIFVISFFKKLVHTEPNTKASTRLLKGNQDIQTAPTDLLSEELFSTTGDYSLKTLSENTDNIIE